MPSHVIILNWNSAVETQECLANLLECQVRAKFVIADNASSDGSVAIIVKWAKELGLKVLHVSESEIDYHTATSDDYDLVIIQNRENYGFAGGNNTALRFAVSRASDGFLWLLNNDARVNDLTFTKIIEKFTCDENVGFVGSVIRYYDTPDTLQCYGGCVVHPALGKRSLYGRGLSVDLVKSLDDSNIDYLMGASLAIRPQVVSDVGVMEHAYFMYAEEMDWQLRAKNAGWTISVASDSHIFHKGAASTSGRSHMYHYYLNRASVMFSTRFFGRISLATVVPSLLAIIAVQNWRTPRNILFGWKGVFEGAAFKWEQQHPFPYRKKE